MGFSSTLQAKRDGQKTEVNKTNIFWAHFQIAEGVVRDCVRSGEVHRVYARMCVLDDERIIEVGQTIEEVNSIILPTLIVVLSGIRKLHLRAPRRLRCGACHLAGPSAPGLLHGSRHLQERQEERK